MSELLDLLNEAVSKRGDTLVKIVFHDNRPKIDDEDDGIPYGVPLTPNQAIRHFGKHGDYLYFSAWGKKFAYLNEDNSDWGYKYIISIPRNPCNFDKWQLED